MKLSAIEAVRYGGLENGCLTGLGDGLTVVLGPNESGKSTLTSLTRHVLYGYPDKRTTERRYEPAGGGRHGRLIFSDSSGEWVVERTEGSKGGNVSVQALRGSERPELLSEITSGVTAQTFKVVFGFGLDELDDIEQGETSDIVARLYAAGAGLAVNPVDVRSKIKSRADELLTQVKSTRKASTVALRLREVKERIRELEAKAAEYASEQRQLAELTERLEPLKAERDELETEVASLVAAAQRSADASAQEVSQARESMALGARIDELRRAAEGLNVDETALAAAPVVNAVLDDLSGFKRRLESITAADAEAAEARRQIAELGVIPDGAADSAENRAAVERWRDQLMQTRTEVRAAEQAAASAEARARKAAEVAAESAQAQTHVAGSVNPAIKYVGFGALVLGALAVLAGAVMSQFIALVLGVLVAAAGIFLVSLRASVPGSVSTFTDEVARLTADARAAREIATQAAAQLVSVESEWRAWLGANHLDANGDDPVAVRALLDALARRDQLLAEAERARASAAREREAAQAWVVRLLGAAVSFEPGAAQLPSFDGALELAARIRYAVERAIEADAERNQLQLQLDALLAERERLDRQLDQTRAILSELANRFSTDPAELVAVVQSRVAQAKERLAELRQQVDAISAEAEQLRGRLDTEGRDDAMARARQEQEGLRAQARVMADDYVVNALAVHLLDRARERYERERQPEMIRTAARVFSAMTEGRYTDVRVPLDGTGISVISGSGQVLDTSRLSRGTAEQLYLALRVGLIGSLGDTGRALPVLMDDVIVNFDPERRRGAVAAVSELAAHHQVVFFTCHPDTAQALSDLVAGTTVIELNRCSL